MSGTIQVAAAAHAAALAAIHRAAFPANEAWGTDAISLQLALPGTFGLFDERGGMLLGRVASDEAEVLTLAVAPMVRRRGIASRLLLAAQAEVRARGSAAMFLEVSQGILERWRCIGEQALSRSDGGGATTLICRMRWYCAFISGDLGRQYSECCGPV